MDTIELKEKLIARITSIDDEALLDQISDFIDFEYNAKGIYKMSPAEIEAVNEGIAQIENGQWISNEEANKIFDKCLKK